jgi:hypothetical protein
LEERRLAKAITEAVRDMMRLADAEILSLIAGAGTRSARYCALKTTRRRRDQIKQAHRRAANSYLKILDEYRDVLNNPDGAHAVHQAAVAERRALANYATAIRAFTQLTVYYRRPQGKDGRQSPSRYPRR